MVTLALLSNFLLFQWIPVVSTQLATTPLPNVLFHDNDGVHSIVEQSVIWLYCTGNSTAATITWTKDGETLVNDPPLIRIRSSSSGISTTSSLVVDNFQASDNGSYVCQTSDGTATVNSSTLSLTASTNTLTVVTNPTDGFPDNRVAVTIGGMQVLRCVGSGSSSPPSVVWVRNGEQVVADGSRINITEETTLLGQRRSSELQIFNFGSSDAGVYQCIFTEGAEVITTAPLRLDTGDVMLERISPQVIVLDPPEKLVIETRASGGYQQFDWTKNMNPFTQMQGQPFSVTLQEFPNFFEIFVQDNTTTNDLGVYEVDLQIITGPQVPEVDFTVTPYSAPTTMNLNGTVTVQEGDSVNIACFSSGNPVPNISWYLGDSLAPFPKSGSVQNFSAEIVGEAIFTFTEGNITSVLQITNATYPAHEGVYTCVGLNSHRGRDSTSNATITVQVQAATTPATGPATGPASGTASGPATGPTTGPTSETTSGSATGPTSEPASGSATGSATGPTIEPAGGSATGPATGPTSETTSGSATGSATLVPATIIVRPMNTTVVSPSPAVFTCVADGVTTPVMTWWRREPSLTQLSSDGINVTITEETLDSRTVRSNLAILQPLPVDAAEYVCVAANELTSVTASAVLTVYVEPTYSFPHEDFTEIVNEAAPVTFICVVVGIPAPNISFYRSGVLLDRSTDPRITLTDNSVPLDFLTSNGTVFLVSRNLTLDNTMDADSGAYTCVASNAVANATQNFELLVQVAPQILDLPDNLTVVEPQNATFSCLATGRPRPDIVWVRLSDMDQLHTQSAGFTFEEQEIGDRERRSNLTILGTQPSDADVYICMAINEPGTATEQATLTIHVIPNITFPLADNFTYTVNENMAVTFTCQATGNPPPEITWMRNRAPLDQSNPQVTLREPKTELYSTGGGVNFIVSQTLTLDNTMDADSGIYTCVASNEVTSVTQNFELFVQVIPMTSSGQTVKVTVGDALTLTVNITEFNRPLTEITWTEDGKMLINNTDNIIITHGSFAAPPTTSTLVRDPITSPMNSGTYELTVVNPAGASMTTFNVTVNAAAEILSPREPAAISVNETDSVNLVCAARGFPAVNVTWWYQNTTQLVDSDPGLRIQSIRVEGDTGFLDITSTLTIQSADRSDAGNYTCVASNTVFGSPMRDIGQFVLTVNFPVTLLASPMDVDVLSPAPAVLNCTATGEPTPQFTWNKVFPNGTTIEVSDSMSNIGISTTLSGENITSTLTINTTNAFDTANYSCTAENMFGPVASSEVQVTVFVPATIIVSPMSTTVMSPSPAVFTCVADGVTTPLMTWWRREPSDSLTQLSSDGINVTISEETLDSRTVRSNLTILQPLPVDATEYVCVATNEFTSVTASAVLTVYVEPSYFLPPVNFTETVNEAAPVTFICVVVGIPAPNISFYRNGVLLDRSTDPHITLTDNSVPQDFLTSNGTVFLVIRILTLDNTMDADSGTYTCVASNAATNVTRDFELFVQVAPQIVEPPDNHTVVELQNATFSCLATGRPRPEIVWVRLSDMVQLHTQSAGFKIEEQEIGDRERQSNLTVMSAHPFDAGTYVCVTRNELGTETEQATLTVHAIPGVTFPLHGQVYTVNETDPVTFTCSATGIPPPEITWMRNRAAFDESNTRVTLSDPTVPELYSTNGGDVFLVSRNLTLDNTMDADSSTYTCVASNGNAMNQTDMRNFELIVKVAPTILEPPENLTVVHPQSATFLCNATARPRPEITWWRMGNQLVEQPGVIEIIDDTSGERMIVSNLTIIMADPSDAGKYMCMATNIAGQDTAAAELTVYVVPEVQLTASPQAVLLGGSTMLTCSIIRANPMDYTFTWTRGDGPTTFKFPETGNTLTLSAVTESDLGVYRCTVNNTAGKGSGTIVLEQGSTSASTDSTPATTDSSATDSSTTDSSTTDVDSSTTVIPPTSPSTLTPTSTTPTSASLPTVFAVAFGVVGGFVILLVAIIIILVAAIVFVCRRNKNPSKKPAKPHSKEVGDSELMPFDEAPVFGITPADDQYVYGQQNWSYGISFDNNNYDEHVFDEHSFDENMFDETPTTHN